MERVAAVERRRRGARPTLTAWTRGALLALGVLVLAPNVQAASIKAVQYGTAPLAAGSASQTATLSPAVDLNRSFLVFSVSEDTPSPEFGQVSGQITNGTTLTFSRATAALSPAITIKWYVAEFQSGVFVQRGSQNIASGGPTFNVTLPVAVTLSKSFPIISLRAVDTSYDDNDFIKAKITTTTNLELSASAPTPAGTRVVEWQVVQYQDANVQTGDVLFAGGIGSLPGPLAPAINTSKSWLLYTYDSASGTPANIGQKLVRGVITNGITLTFDRNNTGQAINLTWYLVEFTDATTVQRNTQPFTTAQTTLPVALTAVDRGRSIAAAGGYGGGGRSNYAAADNTGVGWFTLDITTPTNLQITRGTTGGGTATADVGWFVMSFTPTGCCALTTSATATLLTVDTADVRMVWNTASGGGLKQFYGKNEPNSAINRASDENWYNLVATHVNDGTWYAENTAGAWTLLEATPTRVKLRQNHTYTAGLTLERDWSVYGFPRLATREALGFDGRDLRGSQGIHAGDNQAAAPGACPGAGTFYCSGRPNPTPANPAPAGLVYLVTDEATTYSDMLGIPYTSPFFGRVAANGDFQYSWENNDGLGLPNTFYSYVYEPFPTIPTGAGTDTKFYLYYPFLAGLTSTGTEYQPYANAYRTPDILTINAAKGSRWTDAANSENTMALGDWYNEAEAAYVLNLDPALGLDFDMDGLVRPKQKPFFKIRQWRSLWAPGTMTLESVTQRRSTDFQADVKPVSRALFCTSGAGTCSGTITVLANGGLVGSANEYLADPVSGKNFLLDFLTPGTPGGQHLYIGSDSKFRGINFSLATAGVGATANLQWQYWNGATWINDLEATVGFTPATSNLTVASGVISWDADPAGWATTTVNGGPSLYYVRAYLTAGAYTTRPTEKLIKTDILLLQHCADVTLSARTFVLAAPAPTAVTLAGFTAKALDSAVQLSWETASELDNLGFHLYRAPSPEGPWTRITPGLIPGLGSSPEGKRYSWVDTGLTNAVTYFYRLEDVDRSGLATSHGPVSATAGASAGPAPPGEPGAEAAPSPSAEASSGWKSYGDPASGGLRVLKRSATSLTLELTTGGFSALVQQDGTSRLQVPGFFELSEPGLPQLPTRRAWLEVPAGSQVRVASVAPSELVSFRHLRVSVSGAPQVISERGTYQASFRRVRPEKLRRRLYPETLARVLETAFQGETKKAYLEMSPLRVGSGQVVLARKLVVRLVFQGKARGERSRGGSSGRLEPGGGVKRGAPEGRMLARFATRTAGLHAVAFGDVVSGAAGGVLASSWLRLSRLGQPVAFHVEPRPDRFEPGSTLYFLAEDPQAAYSTETVYELAIAAGGVQMPAERSSRNAVPNTPVPALVARRSFEANTNYLPALLNARDLWLWDFGLLAPNGRDYPFTLTAPSAAPGPAVLSLDLQGGSDSTTVDPDHAVRVFVNGVPVGEARWDGLNSFRLEASVDASILSEGVNALRLENLDTTGAFDSVVYLDRFTVEYPRDLVADAGRLEGRAPSSGLVRAAGLSAGTLLLDLTASPPRWLTPALTGSGLAFPAEAQKSYLAVSPEALLRPEIRPAAAAASLRQGSQQADWILVAPRELLPAAEPLVLQRQAQGLSAMAVSLEQIRDEFGFGEVSPQAIRDFLAFAYHHWTAPSPRYVLLLGDASSDPKGFLPTATRKDLLPSPLTKSTFLWTASDPSLAAVNGDDAIPDLAIGRITAGSLAEAEAAIRKILAFEQAGQTLAGNAVLVADNPDLAGDFEANANDIATLLPGRPLQRIYLTQYGSGAAARAAVLNAFNTGAALVSYVGHGSQGLWASEGILRVSDLGLLQPQPRQPLLLTMTCSNGYFISPWSNALSERLVLAQDKGAIAAFSPSGLSLDEAAHLFHRALVQELEHGGHERLGDLVLAAQKDYADTGAFPELLSIYHLFADPALKVR